MNLFDLSGMCGVVVGGSGDLGSSIIDGLLEAGASKIANIDLNSERESQSSCRALNSPVRFIRSDVRHEDEIAKSFSEAIDFLGGEIHFLVNAAGIQRRSRAEIFSRENWDEVIEVNLNSVFQYMQLASLKMMKNRFGKIVNIGSIMGVFGGLNICAYSASKGAVSQLSRSFCNDLAKYGINFNTVLPGYFDTKLNTGLMSDKSRVQEITSRIPQERWGNLEDIKGAVIFLCSRGSDYINGANIVVDGGYSVR